MSKLSAGGSQLAQARLEISAIHSRIKSPIRLSRPSVEFWAVDGQTGSNPINRLIGRHSFFEYFEN